MIPRCQDRGLRGVLRRTPCQQLTGQNISARGPGGVTAARHGTVTHVAGRYPGFLARTGSCARHPSSHGFGFIHVPRVFAGCCVPLLEGGRSRRYLRESVSRCLDRYPGCPCGAHARFFPHGIGLPPCLTRQSRNPLAISGWLSAVGVRASARRQAPKLLFPHQPQRKQTMNDTDTQTAPCRTPWNKGKLIGQKPPLKLREVWTVRIRLQIAGNTRELALFNLAIDSKLRACDLVRLMVRDVAHGTTSSRGRPKCSEKPSRPRRSNSPSERVGATAPGWPRRSCSGATISSQVGSVSRPTACPASARGSPRADHVARGGLARDASIASAPSPRPGSPGPCSPRRSTGCRPRRAGCLPAHPR